MMLRFSPRHRPSSSTAVPADDAAAVPDPGAASTEPTDPPIPGSAPSASDASRFAAIDLRSSLSSAIRSLVAHAPHGEGPSEDVVRTVASQIAAASDDVVDVTADLLKNGSRTTIFGILAGTVLLGWIIGRSTQPPRFT
jgi:hypothetical protein